ncbi:hypothetical protein BGZ60DRAFT_553823 [Tricladium varicosporioides]|nr:hypothetical protein BGZ60DRAFT_553823 [Hymenoscyphus varicosporioides]
MSIQNSLSLTLFTLFSTAAAFGTWNATPILGQHAEHEYITRAGLWCGEGHPSDGKCFEDISMNQLAGRPGNVGGVGAPDWNKLTLFPEGEAAHLDNADFLDKRFLNTGDSYPQSRILASTTFMNGIDHLRMRWRQGRDDAKALLDKNENIRAQEAYIQQTWECTFAGNIRSPWFGARAKCNVFDGFGRALHGVQDFYSHSNYADIPGDHVPISITNPPGLGRNFETPLLDLRSESRFYFNEEGDFDQITKLQAQRESMEPKQPSIPYDLSTGCFATLDQFENIPFACKGRIRHRFLEKDHGFINLITPFKPTWQTGGLSYTTSKGPAGTESSARSDIQSSNFNAAVTLAVKDTIRQWTFFRDALRLEYGASKGNLMICSLVRDDPLKDCYGRRIAIVVDSSGSNTWTDPTNQRIKAAIALAKTLTTSANAEDGTAPDRVTVIDFDDFARVVSPMGDPSKVTFNGIDSEGGTDIGSGISLAIDEILKSDSDPVAHQSGIILLTDGSDGNPANQIRQLERAAKAGIRVSIGFLDPTSLKNINKRHLSRRDPAMDLLFAILHTGGTYSTIDTAEAQENFINLVSNHGLTDMDSPSGLASVSTFLLPDLTIADLISVEPRRFLYIAKAGERLNITVTKLSHSLSISATLQDIGQTMNISTLSVNTTATVFRFEAITDTVLQLEVDPLFSNKIEGAFTVGLRTHLPPPLNEKNASIPTNGTHTGPSGTGTGSGTYPTSIVSGLWTNGTAANSSNIVPTTTVITTSSITICPLTTTAIDGWETRVIATNILSTVIYTTTVVLPCPKCPGYISGYAPTTNMNNPTTKGSLTVGSVTATMPLYPSTPTSPSRQGNRGLPVATGSSNATTSAQFTGTAGMKVVLLTWVACIPVFVLAWMI